MTRVARWLVRTIAFEHGRAVGLYKRICRPDGLEWAAFLKRRGVLRSIGDRCSIQTSTVFTDPQYVRLGSNVRLSGCTLFGHDGSVNMINAAFGCAIDHVGAIDVRDNVFIGHQAIVMPGVAIGPNAIVAAGAVVTRDVAPNTIVAGVPARPVGALDTYVARMQARTAALPWKPLLDRRTHDNYWQLAPAIEQARLETFFGSPRS